MKCFNLRCQRDLTITDISKMTDRNRYRFCRPCKGSKTVPIEISCIGCGNSVAVQYNYRTKYCSYLCMQNDRRLRRKLIRRYPTYKEIITNLLI